MIRSDLMIRGWDVGRGESTYRDATDADLRALGYVRLDGVDAELCLTHGSAFYDEALCALQMARLYHETGGNNLAGLAWVGGQYGECEWAAALAEGDTTNV